MEKEFIPYEQALALKELGFDEPCFRGWYLDESLYYHPDSDIVLDNPTFSQAFRWFRDNHSLYVKYIKNDLQSHVFSYKDDENAYKLASKRNNYEEAELECLKKLIEITKEKLAQPK